MIWESEGGAEIRERDLPAEIEPKPTPWKWFPSTVTAPEAREQDADEFEDFDEEDFDDEFDDDFEEEQDEEYDAENEEYPDNDFGTGVDVDEDLDEIEIEADVDGDFDDVGAVEPAEGDVEEEDGEADVAE